MNEGKQILGVVKLLEDTFSLIGLIGKSNYNHSSEKLTNSLIYASNHLPHKLLAIKEKFQELATQGSKEKVLKDIEMLAYSLSHDGSRLKDIESLTEPSIADKLREEINAIINDENQQDIDTKFNNLIKFFNDYINSKLHEATKVDCLRRARKIKKIQKTITTQAQKDAYAILNALNDNQKIPPQIIILNDHMKRLNNLKGEEGYESRKSNIYKLIDEELSDFFSDQTKEIQPKMDEINQRLELLRTERAEELIRLRNQKTLCKEHAESIEKIKIDIKQLESDSSEIDPNIIVTQEFGALWLQQIEMQEKLDLSLQKIHNFEKNLEKYNQEIFLTEGRINNLQQLLTQAENIQSSYQNLEIIDIIMQVNNFLFLKNLAMLEHSSSHDDLNKKLMDIAKLSNFFTLDDEEQNLQNIRSIEGTRISNHQNSDFDGLKENIMHSSVSKYFNTAKLAYIEFEEQRMREILQTHEDETREKINANQQLDLEQQQILDLLEIVKAERLKRQELKEDESKMLEMLNMMHAQELGRQEIKDDESKDLQDMLLNIDGLQGDEREDLQREKIEKDELTVRKSMLAYKIQEEEIIARKQIADLLEQTMRSLTSYLLNQEEKLDVEKVPGFVEEWKSALDKANNPEDIYASTRILEQVIGNLSIKAINQTLSEQGIPIAEDASSQHVMKILGDEAQMHVEKLQQASYLAQEIINIIRQAKDIDPNKATSDQLHKDLITLANDLPHKLKGTTEGNKRFF